MKKKKKEEKKLKTYVHKVDVYYRVDVVCGSFECELRLDCRSTARECGKWSQSLFSFVSLLAFSVPKRQIAVSLAGI